LPPFCQWGKQTYSGPAQGKLINQYLIGYLINRTDYPSGFIQKNRWLHRIQSNTILPAAHKFLPAVHKNLACGINSPRRTLQEASSQEFTRFQPKLFKTSSSLFRRAVILFDKDR